MTAAPWSGWLAGRLAAVSLDDDSVVEYVDGIMQMGEDEDDKSESLTEFLEEAAGESLGVILSEAIVYDR